FEDQNTMKNETENKRRQVEEAELRLQREREEDERKQQRMMERIQYEQQEKEKIVCRIYLLNFIVKREMLLKQVNFSRKTRFRDLNIF
ncbi:unnamed protein product, partial [Rotaria sordida]